jgi:hypothetical protein
MPRRRMSFSPNDYAAVVTLVRRFRHIGSGLAGELGETGVEDPRGFQQGMAVRQRGGYREPLMVPAQRASEGDQ